MNDAREGGGATSPGRHARYLWAAELLQGSRVLDAACGRGEGTAVLAGHATAVGVDFSPAAILEARHAHGGVAEFREGDLVALPFADGEFDHAVCFEAIAHVRDPARTITELRRVMRPGGLLLISAPNREAHPPGNPLHLSPVSPGELGAMLRERFANVAVHRQQTYFASLLGDATLSFDDSDGAIEPEVRKLAGGPAGSELHAVAVATDGELPPPPAWLAIGEGLDLIQQRELLREWQERAVRAEARALALGKELRSLQ